MSDYRTCDVRPTVLMSNYHIDPIEHVPFVMSDVHTFDLKIFVMSDVHAFDLKLLVVLLSFGSLAQQFFRMCICPLCVYPWLVWLLSMT